jgi:Zn-dependent protease
MGLIEFIVDNKIAIIAYLILFSIIYINRKKFQVEGKIMFLYRTKYGINFINKFAKKYNRLVKILGYVAIVFGVIGMLAICGLAIKGVYELFFVPSAPPTVSLVIPGVSVPGSPITIPLGYGVLALFIVVLIHEFGHGIVASAHGVKIKNTGFGLMLFLPLAFVEPDEKQVEKKKSSAQQAFFAAGPFMNILLAFVVSLLVSFAFFPLFDHASTPIGISFSSITKNYPAEKYGVQRNTVYTHFNGMPVNNTDDFYADFQHVKPGDTITLTDASYNTVSVITTSHPDNASVAYLGVKGIKNEYRPRTETFWGKIYYTVALFFKDLFFWVYALSLGIGLANLLPIGPVDGGRILHRASIDRFGKKKGIKIWSRISWVVLAIMIMLVIVPILRAIFLKT